MENLGQRPLLPDGWLWTHLLTLVITCSKLHILPAKLFPLYKGRTGSSGSSAL